MVFSLIFIIVDIYIARIAIYEKKRVDRILKHGNEILGIVTRYADDDTMQKQGYLVSALNVRYNIDDVAYEIIVPTGEPNASVKYPIGCCVSIVVSDDEAVLIGKSDAADLHIQPEQLQIADSEPKTSRKGTSSEPDASRKGTSSEHTDGNTEKKSDEYNLNNELTEIEKSVENALLNKYPRVKITGNVYTNKELSRKASREIVRLFKHYYFSSAAAQAVMVARSRNPQIQINEYCKKNILKEYEHRCIKTKKDTSNNEIYAYVLFDWELIDSLPQALATDILQRHSDNRK